ncbi:ATP-dependent Clp protease ATP-binding subunit [Solibaculum mannosilyticum]|uniref:Chaperone ClpB n=1 Tax=Solibaculum mannosilyticum TaxID=2780922 RepID=A0A7I8D718_9FIRM|nr:ATP-dependent Clp protease ATP-binding subunit [Solibaculum mannosilyticum]BCI61512.1 chaperone ClpB [Solibaculum mannosilyticum]CZT55733.1 ATP-dependent Clp protease ATP-binding subunit ClpC [Eubacteriaceae bacterium CHKCI005]
MMCSKCKKRVAVVFITRMEGDKSVNEGLCMVCAQELGIKPVQDIIDKMGVSAEELEAMSEQMTSLMPTSDEDSDNFELGGAATLPPYLQEMFDPNKGSKENEELEAEKVGKNKKEKAKAGPKNDKEKKRKFLDTYCTDLTRRAREGQLDQVIGREQEIYRVIQILSRRTKNNPCLIGEPGVGKTAIAEGLALRIAKGDVPLRLMDKEVHLLDLTALVAGTQFRGQFESRVKGLVDEVKADGNIILFIDEVHNLVGTGDAEGSMNAANILKPALSRGEIQVIGATTFTEYRKYIEKDAALERRFQPVTVEEPSIQDTVTMLQGIKGYYEAHHRVQVPDGILRRTVSLAERYITDRFLPDKAIDLLDEACAHAALGNADMTQYDRDCQKLDDLHRQEEELTGQVENIDYEALAKVRTQILQIEKQIEELKPKALGSAVTPADLAQVIELWTGIPAARVEQGELGRLSLLEQHLKEHVIGQDEAVKAVAAAVRRSRVQISARRRPASFIFVGPTGVGKTELVKVLAAELFDRPETLIRLDMSEFMEKHSVSRIIGSPPGYVGYDEAGQLTEKVRRKPYSVLLFDEIEKAHPDVMNILLQILDEGRITDAQGRTVNFENTVIVMTSNAGSSDRSQALGFGKTQQDASREKVMKALSDFLRPEFISRVDEVVVFRPLSYDDYLKIAQLMLKEIKEPLSDKGILFTWDGTALAVMARRVDGGRYGARDLRNLIRREVEDQIAALLVEHADHQPGAMKLVGEGDKLSILTL